MSLENAIGLEAVYFLGAVVLLAALIYGTLRYRAGDEVLRGRYRQNQG